MNPQQMQQMLMQRAAQGKAVAGRAIGSQYAPYVAGAAGLGAVGLGAAAMMGGGSSDPAALAEAAYQQQLADQIATAERAGQFKHNLEMQAANTAYNQQMGVANDQQDYEMAVLEKNLKAAQAEQILNGHLSALAEGRNAAATVGQARFY